MSRPAFAIVSARGGRAVTALACGGVFLVSSTGCRVFTRAPGAPHSRGVVLVLADALGTDPGAGHTPVLAGLAEAGRRFDQAFAPDPRPGVARAALLGEGATSLPARFRAGGAAVAGAGSEQALPIDPSAWDLHIPASPGESEVLDGLEAWLRSQSGPFLLVAAVGGAPGPVEGQPAPAPLAGTFAPALPLIAVRDLGFAERPGGVTRPFAWSETSRRRAAAGRLQRAMVADAQLGRLLEMVRKAAPGSAVAVVGDPPPDAGAHGLIARPDVLFDDTLRCDLVFAAPGIARAGRSSRRLVSTLDLVPALLEVVGFPVPPSLLGDGLGPLLVDPGAAGRDEVVASVPRRAGRLGRSARSARWRYTQWPDGSQELYDHRTDPGEITNLVRRPEHRATIEEMQRAFETPPPADVTAAPSSPSGARPRNVLLVVVDDLTTRVGAWGAPVRTPNIDRLAARGIRFERAYVQVAMCSPSRTSMLTGWRPERTGVWQNFDPARPPGAVPLQEHFAAHGAVTAGVGKIYHYPESFRWDVQTAHPVAAEAETEDDDAPEKGGRSGVGHPATGTDLDQPDGQRARRGAELLEAYRHRAFFLAVGLVRPHKGWIAPARYFEMYPPASVVLPPFIPDDLADVPAVAVKTKSQPLPGLPLLGREPAGLDPDEEFLRQAISAYQACTTFADAQVGVLLDTLDRLDLWKNTVVVLVGDNGYHLGEHGGMVRKDTLFEEALHVPFIIAAPGLPHPGAVVRTPVEVLDLYPTVTELAGLPAVPGLDGVSLAPLLANPEGEGRRPAVSYRRVRPPTRGVSIRTPAWRYTLWPDGSEELYDLSSTAAESENLADRPERAAEKDRLRGRLLARVAEGTEDS